MASRVAVWHDSDMANELNPPDDGLIVVQGSYTIRDLIGWQRDGTLELRPHFQRGSVWNAKDKSFLVDSIAKGFPIPLIVLQNETRNSPTDVIRRVVDGQQRLRTLISFVDRGLLDDVAESDDWLYYPERHSGRSRKGYDFGECSARWQGMFLGTHLSVATVEAGATMAQVLEIYDRLNSTGSALKPQELRYAKREGRFSDLSYRLARRHQSRWIDWKVFRPAEMSRMKEVEFTSELILLLINGINKTGRREIDEAYTQYGEQIPEEAALESKFDQVMDALDDALANPSSPDGLRTFRSRGWFYAVFAWQAGHAALRDGELGVRLEKLAERISEDRRTDPELIRAISGSASDRRSRVDRFDYLATGLGA